MTPDDPHLRLHGSPGEISTAAVHDNIVPLRRSVIFAGEIRQQVGIPVNQRSQSTGGNGLSHALGNAAEHSVAPEIRAVFSRQGSAVQQWNTQRARLFRLFSVVGDLKRPAVVGDLLLGDFYVDVRVDVQRVVVLRLSADGYVKVCGDGLVAAYAEHNAFRAEYPAVPGHYPGSAAVEDFVAAGQHPVYPLGDPIEVTVRGYELSLRKADAEMIEVE